MHKYMIEDLVKSLNITQMAKIAPMVHSELAYVGILG